MRLDHLLSRELEVRGWRLEVGIEKTASAVLVKDKSNWLLTKDS